METNVLCEFGGLKTEFARVFFFFNEILSITNISALAWDSTVFVKPYLSHYKADVCAYGAVRELLPTPFCRDVFLYVKKKGGSISVCLTPLPFVSLKFGLHKLGRYAYYTLCSCYLTSAVVVLSSHARVPVHYVEREAVRFFCCRTSTSSTHQERLACSHDTRPENQDVWHVDLYLMSISSDATAYFSCPPWPTTAHYLAFTTNWAAQK